MLLAERSSVLDVGMTAIAAKQPPKATRARPYMGWKRHASSTPAEAVAGQASPLAGDSATCWRTVNFSFRC